jgi:biuret amidohydrolase
VTGAVVAVPAPVAVAADPYPWPWEGVPDPARLVLVVTGWDEHWRARVGAPDAVARAVDDLAVAVHAVGGATVWLAHERPPRAPAGYPDPAPLDPPHSVAGRSVRRSVAGIDGFAGSALESTLRRWGTDQVLLAGYGLETTVHSTMRSANDRGFGCLLVTDASGACSAETAPGAVASVTMSGGIFGAVAPLARVLDALAGAEHPTVEPATVEPATVEPPEETP